MSEVEGGRTRRTLVLAGLGGASIALYGLLALGMRHSNAANDVAAFLGVLGALFALHAAAFVVARAGAGRRALAIVLLFGVGFRMVMLFAGLPQRGTLAALAGDLAGQETGYRRHLLYDNDVWRYLWDGHVAASGMGPYRFTPAEIEARAQAGEAPFERVLRDELWWEVLDNVSFQSYGTVYPPLSQLLFRIAHAVAPGSVLALKFLVVLVDLAACQVLVRLLGALGRRRTDVLLYAWNPLVIAEFAGSGHADSLMVLLVTLAVGLLVRERRVAALALLGLAGLAKAGALVLAPLFLGRSRPREWIALPATLAAGLVPYLGQLDGLRRGLAAYGREWVFNSGAWATVRRLAGAAGASDPALVAHTLAAAAVLVAALAAARLGRGSPQRAATVAFAVLALLILVSPAVMPWYLPWALPLAIAVRCRSWTVLTATSLLSYLFYVDGVERAWWLWLEYGLFAAASAVELARRRRRRPRAPE